MAYRLQFWVLLDDFVQKVEGGRADDEVEPRVGEVLNHEVYAASHEVEVELVPAEESLRSLAYLRMRKKLMTSTTEHTTSSLLSLPLPRMTRVSTI